MSWEFRIFTSVTLLVLLHTPEIPAVSQESSYVIECIRDMIPHQIYNECCERESNCSVSRQQNRGIDCMSRSIMTNYSSMFSDSRESGSATTEMSFSYTRSHQWYDVLDTLAEICRRQPRARLQTCIRNELIKRCRFSMLQDRFTSAPGRWVNQRHLDRGSPYNVNYGSRIDPHKRIQFYGAGRGGNPEGALIVMGRPMDFGSNSESKYFSRGGYSDDMDDEEFGYSDSESMRYK
ncbi:hypothetical protein X975_26840, partial [Stegodyphus mimosarum]